MSPGHGWKLRYGSSALIRHSMAWPRRPSAVALEAERLAGGDPDLLLHQVEAGHHLGDRMLDLDPGVHLHEVEATRRRRAGTRWCRRRRSRCRRRARTAASPIRPRSSAVERGARALLDQLLVAALHRAVALAQVHHLAVAVAHDLDLDVPRAARGTSRRTPRRCRRPPAPRSAPGRRAARTAPRRARSACPSRRRPPSP